MDTEMRRIERQAATGDTQAQEHLRRLRARVGLVESPMAIVINGEALEVNNTRCIGYGDLWELSTDEGDFIVSEDAEKAGAAARERWQEMAENDPSEFRCLVGDETLVRWALGQSAGPGSVQVNSLNEWLDLTAEHPEEEWAGYDGDERTVEACGEDIVEELGYKPGVAYRCN